MPVRPLHTISLSDTSGEVTQIHVTPGTLYPEGRMDISGHTLHFSCDCTPRLEYIDNIAVFRHRRDI